MVKSPESFAPLKQPFTWHGDHLSLLDQTLLPGAEKYLTLTSPGQVAEAICSLRVRGAPAIGIAAGYGVVLGAIGIQSRVIERNVSEMEEVFRTMAGTRPTARNLFDVLERLRGVSQGMTDPPILRQTLESEVVAIHEAQKAADECIAVAGAALLGPASTFLTHCNTGPLATAGYGTALGIIIAAHRSGKIKMVLATETRPLLQGARLTAWELQQARVPFRVITDSMAAHLMGRGEIDGVIVGADRIAANGDTANKIGTYSLALLAGAHRLPFYVAAPFSTIDLKTADGSGIPIEERSEDEVNTIQGIRITPADTRTFNPAFDVTPAGCISAIVTEKGVFTGRAGGFDFTSPI